MKLGRHLSYTSTLIIASLFTGTAHASDWWFVEIGGSEPNRTVVFVDKESATAQSVGKIDAWILNIEEKPNSEGVRKSKLLQTYNCGSRTTKTKTAIRYGNNDRYIDTIDIPSYRQSDSYVVPDSVGESVWKFICVTREKGIQVKGRPEEMAALIFREFK